MARGQTRCRTGQDVYSAAEECWGKDAWVDVGHTLRLKPIHKQRARERGTPFLGYVCPRPREHYPVFQGRCDTFKDLYD